MLLDETGKQEEIDREQLEEESKHRTVARLKANSTQLVVGNDGVRESSTPPVDGAGSSGLQWGFLGEELEDRGVLDVKGRTK